MWPSRRRARISPPTRADGRRHRGHDRASGPKNFERRVSPIAQPPRRAGLPVVFLKGSAPPLHCPGSMRSISRKIAFCCQVLVTAVACVVVLFTAGCGGECHSGQTRCEGKVYQVCDDEGDVLFAGGRWVDAQQCSGTCRVNNGQARCVAAQASLAEAQAPLACVLNLAR